MRFEPFHRSYYINLDLPMTYRQGQKKAPSVLMVSGRSTAVPGAIRAGLFFLPKKPYFAILKAQMAKYNPSKIEKKWQKYWEAEKLHEVSDDTPNKKNFMLLVEFPYPSGDLHVGHWYTFALADIYARYLKMQNYNVMYPMGFDAFGLPAENAAISRGIHPKDWTKKNIANMTKQFKMMGARFDWSRQVSTIEPEYYKWTQWIFLKLYEAGLAYRTKTLVNWCPHDKTVLANEQVINGKCDRCHNEVEQRELAQWMFKITDFADQLVDDMKNLDWPEVTKSAQENWIGRSEGTLIEFPISNSQFLNQSIEVFTTRADTVFGATYVVLAPEHPLVEKLKTQVLNLKEVENYQAETKKKTELQRVSAGKEKSGVKLEGIEAINPINNERVSVWIADYVLAQYGTGAVMAVPAHDQRDFDFAKKFNLPIKEVVLNDEKFVDHPVEKEGVLINSGPFDGMQSAEARQKITEKLKSERLGGPEKKYRLHDWILSRQRYWGAPIPMIHCEECGYQPVPEKDLPVKLPALDNFLPADDGRSPLAKAEKWLHIKCPKCGKPAERETDTMDTFVDSSWYYLRYTDPNNDQEFASREKMRPWLPVPMYIGGPEHNTMHLLYARFIAKALYSQKLIEFNEPFLSRRNHSIVLATDGRKMSKSLGNVVDPDEQVDKFGADAVRMYLAFLGPFHDQMMPWSTEGIVGVSRFLNRAWDFLSRANNMKLAETGSDQVNLAINRAIKDVGRDIAQQKFNTGVSGLMKLWNSLEEHVSEQERLSESQYESILKVMAPFAPHMTEEIWQEVLGKKTSVHGESWPEYDEKVLAEELVTVVVQVNGKVRDTIQVKQGTSETEIKELIASNEKIQKALETKEIKKLIYIPDKLVNLVV